MTYPFPPSGLYAIVNDNKPAPQLLATAEAAIAGGARVLQYRGKTSRPLPLVQQLLELCHRHEVPLIINDDMRLTRIIGADGVHLGRNDEGLEFARDFLGPEAILGISCYNSLERAIKARQFGADYVAFGRFYPSKTKPKAPAAALAILSEAKRCLDIPIVAIGGITPDNGSQLLRAGADLLAAIEGVFGANDTRQAARHYAELFNR